MATPIVYIQGGLVQYASEPVEVVDYDIEGADPASDDICTCRKWEIDRDHFHHAA